MIKQSFIWWSTQMRGWLPAWLDPARADSKAVVLEYAEDGAFVSAALRRPRHLSPLGRFPLDPAGLRSLRDTLPPRPPRATLLRLPNDLLLERQVTLPLAAEREAERVLGYEMDRFTPFASADIFWTWVIEHRDRARERLHVRLSVVAKASVQTALAALAQSGLGPTALEVARPDAMPCRISLQRGVTRRERLAGRAVAAAAFGCAMLALSAAALPFITQEIRRQAVEAQIAALRPAVTEAETLQRRLAASSAGVDVISAERSRVGDTLAVLATVTDKLPDNTYLTDFSLRQGKLLLNGQSAAAAQLIAALSGNPVIRNPEFVAPVTRVDNGRTDVFAIRAEIVPEAAP